MPVRREWCSDHLRPPGQLHGGLMSPAMLRVGGILLILAPWPWLLADPRNPSHWLHVVSLTTAGIAAWILAARRQRRDAPDHQVSVPTSEPLG